MTEEQIAVARAIHDAGLYGESFEQVVEEVLALFERDRAAGQMHWQRDAVDYWTRVRARMPGRTEE